jgi:hypothetical protein
MQPRAGGRAGAGGALSEEKYQALNAGVTVGIVLGCFLALGIVGCLCLRYSRKNRKDAERRVEQERRWWMEGRR